MRNKKNVRDVLNRIKKNSKYNLDEVKYTPIIEDNDEFDNLPDDIANQYMTQDGQPTPNIPGTGIFGEADDDVIDPNAPAPPPAEGGVEQPNPNDNQGQPPQNPEMGDETNPMPDDQNDAVDNEFGGEGEPIEEPEPPKEDPGKEVDELQNEIIKNNIAAMESMVNKLDSLDQYINQVTQQLDDLNKKVKEVEEPSNVEKMLKQKDVSYPFYLNLNDYWDGNFFDQRREELGEEGIKKLPDGTFIADFDDLPVSHNDINSNDEIV